MRHKSLVFAVLIMFALSGIAMAEKAGDSNFKTRYGTESTTPITDIDALDGISSNVQDQLDAGGTGTLTDTYVFVGNGSNVATGVALTVSGDATGTGDNTGDVAITLAADSVSASQFGPINTVTATIEAGWVGLDTSVEPGSILLNTELISGFSNDTTLNRDTYDTSTGIWSINSSTPVGAGTLVINGTFLRP